MPLAQILYPNTSGPWQTYFALLVCSTIDTARIPFSSSFCILSILVIATSIDSNILSAVYLPVKF